MLGPAVGMTCAIARIVAAMPGISSRGNDRRGTGMMVGLHRTLGAATVGDAYDKDDQLVVEQLVDDAVVGKAQAAETA